MILSQFNKYDRKFYRKVWQSLDQSTDVKGNRENHYWMNNEFVGKLRESVKLKSFSSR